ncbi:MAG: hypothetical protein ACJAT2_002313 [Bacteriovoracaceae bacterium]|jgi:hypothetical protein
MMTVEITCPECGSGINIYPSVDAKSADCDVCQHSVPTKFNEEHTEGRLCDCPVCERKDFFQQKDFSRKIGVLLFVIAACFVPWTYGISLIVLWLVDLFLFRRIPNVVICYKCQTNFRGLSNLKEIPQFNHEMNDRIIYSDHDFEGKPLEHH